MKTKFYIKVIASILSVTGIIVTIGFGCGLAYQPVGEYKAASTGDIVIPGIGGSTNDVVVVAGKQTVMVPRTDNLYKTLLSQLQVPANATTKAEFDRQVGSMSENGSSASINASFTFAAITLSAAICAEKIRLEGLVGVNDATRIFFNGIDLNGNVSQLNDAVINGVVNRLARANWGRNETVEERAMLIGEAGVSGVRQSIQLDANNAANNVGPKTREALLYLCTSVASSVSSYQL